MTDLYVILHPPSSVIPNLIRDLCLKRKTQGEKRKREVFFLKRKAQEGKRKRDAELAVAS